MSSFASMKKARKKSFTDLQSKAKEAKEGTKAGGNKDDRFWQPEVDKAGNGRAKIRFLPAPKDNIAPWIQYFSHGFKHPQTGQWYIENSRTTFQASDPLGEYNNRLWNSGTEANKKIASIQKRKLHFVSNILVMDDPNHPENNGKVFLYRYGKKIYEKIEELMNPTFDGDEEVNPFDLWEGCDFELRIVKKDGFRNYDKSSFQSASEVGENDEGRETIWNSEYDLKEFTDPDGGHYKSYDDLKARLTAVLGADPETIDVMGGVPEYQATPPPKPIPQKPSAEQMLDNDPELSEFEALAG